MKLRFVNIILRLAPCLALSGPDANGQAAPPGSPLPDPLSAAVQPAGDALPPGASADTDDAVSARALLNDVAARLPREALTIRGTVTVRRRRGIEEDAWPFEMEVDWGRRPSFVRYRILDAFGTPLEELELTGLEDGTPSVGYAAGVPLSPADPPGLHAPVRGSDITWSDLAFVYLWWPPSDTVATDTLRGRTCFVVDVTPPPADTAACAGMRLWIDREVRMLMQAEALDARGRPVRRLWVKSFKKIDGRWMVQDMEIESMPAVRRTRVRIREVSASAGHDGHGDG